MSFVRSMLESWRRRALRSIVILLVYAGLVVLWSAVLITLGWPHHLLLVLTIPIVWAALYYPRSVYFTMSLILSIGTALVTTQYAVNFWTTLVTITIGTISFLIVLELIHALVTENWNTEEVLHQHNRELAAINAIAMTITATLDLEQVLQRLVDTAEELFPQASAATIQMLDERHETMVTTAASSGAVAVPQKAIFRPGQGIAGLALQERQPIRVADVRTDPRFLPGSTPPVYRSLLVTPLVTSQSVFGTLSLEATEANAFHARDEHLANTLAQHAAVAIENARLYQETHRRLRESKVLQIIAKAATSLDFDQVMRETVEAVHRLLGVERVVVLIPDETANVMRRHLAASIGFDTAPVNIPMDRSISGQVYRTGQTIRLDDVAQAANYFEGTPDTLCELCVPLWSGDKVIGVLNIESPRPSAFDEADARLFETIAAQLATALESARLFERVRTAERQYRGLFEGSADPIAVLDAEGVFLDANPAACKVLGRPREELLGQKAYVVNPQPKAAFLEMMQQVLDGHVIRYELSPTINGDLHHFEARMEPIGYNNRPAIQWTAHDVTARRDLEHWREELTAIIVHNLRNPLTWIKSGVGMAQMLLPHPADPDLVKALETATKGIERMEQQIDVLLNIGRAEAGQEITNRQLLNPAELVQDVVELLTPRAAAKGVELHVELPASLPTVRGNRHMLIWTLQNLLDNAIKFSPPGEHVHIWVTYEPTELHISVTDHGPGIRPDDRERIFQKYYQAQHGESRQGSGLGLYFCRLAVEAHAGKIWVTNNRTVPGSTFTFTLPVEISPQRLSAKDN